MGQKILFTITLTPLNFIEYCQRVFNYGKHRNILLNSAKKTLEISIFRQEGLLEPLAYYTHFFSMQAPTLQPPICEFDIYLFTDDI